MSWLGRKSSPLGCWVTYTIIYIYIYIYIRERERERERERQTDRQRERETDRQTDRQRLHIAMSRVGRESWPLGCWVKLFIYIYIYDRETDTERETQRERKQVSKHTCAGKHVCTGVDAEMSQLNCSRVGSKEPGSIMWLTNRQLKNPCAQQYRFWAEIR